MSLESTINADIKAAMLAKDSLKLNALRAIKSAILLAKTEKTGTLELDPKTELAILQKLAKQRKEAFSVFQEQKREDLALEEKLQLEVIETYLPSQISDEELIQELSTIIQEMSSNGPPHPGKLMGHAARHFEGRADNGRISAAIKSILDSQ
jgi:uncharacterized protein YqeY